MPSSSWPLPNLITTTDGPTPSRRHFVALRLQNSWWPCWKNIHQPATVNQFAFATSAARSSSFSSLPREYTDVWHFSHVFSRFDSQSGRDGGAALRGVMGYSSSSAASICQRASFPSRMRAGTSRKPRCRFQALTEPSLFSRKLQTRESLSFNEPA